MFRAKPEHDQEFAAWFTGLLADVDGLAADTAQAVGRLTDLQVQLIALIGLLDPGRERFPQFRLAYSPRTPPRS
ncbi:hypothetical protein [Streptomyces sp. SID9727]|uniref:hypothetical protein n=1 Tax=Streptomyces sp. SID9727 TaxID=2706114 RepID=UPI001EF22F3A|nr:hypothetical protein [Streptomyces sp. SID9727]